MTMINKKQVLREAFSETMAVCPVTGISYQIIAPRATKKFAFEQRHPLASYNESISFSRLSPKEQSDCHPAIISGAILVLLAYHGLRQDKLSNKEANIYLSNNNQHTLISALSFISQLSQRLAKKLPQLAISEHFEISSWLWAAKTSISVPIQTAKQQSSNLATSNTKRQAPLIVNSIEPETRKEFKYLLDQVKDLIAPKLVQILKSSMNGNLLATMGDSLRTNLVKGLSSYDLPETTRLASILSKIRANSSVQESITRQQLDGFETMQTIESVFGPTLSLADQIKAKLAAKIGHSVEATSKTTAAVPASSNSNTISSTISASNPKDSLKNFRNELLSLAEEVDQDIANIQDFLKEETFDIEELDIDGLDFDSEDQDDGEDNDLPE